MATSGSWSKEWASGTWGGYPKGYRWTGNWSKSGNTITLSNQTLQMYMISGTGWGSGTDTVTTTGGTAQSVSFTMSGSSSNVANLANSQFSVSSSQTSATISCTIADEVTGQVGISFDVAPTTPTVSLASTTPDTLGISYGTTSFGNPSSGTVYLYGGTSANPTDQIASKTTTGSSTFSWTGLAANTAYYVRARAANAQASSSYSSSLLVVTTAASPTVTLSSKTNDSATFAYTTEADGGYYPKIIEYSLDGTTWNTVATIATGDASSGTFTITGLSSESVTVAVRTRTTSGESAATTITVEIGGVNSVVPVGGTSKRAGRALASVNGIAREITRILVSNNGVAVET